MRAFQPILPVLLAASATAQIQSHVEDFSTTTFQDFANNEVDWNTTDGELKLFELPALGNNFLAGFNSCMAVQGDFAYLGRSDGLVTVDISDPGNPFQVDYYFTFDPVFGVAVDGDRAYLGTNSIGLVVLDISIPSAPSLETTISPAFLGDSTLSSVEVEGEQIFVGGTSGQASVVNRGNLTNTGIVLLPAWNAQDIAVAGNLAAALHLNTHVRFFDVDLTDFFSDPVLIGSFAIANPSSVALQGNIAYVGAGSSGLYLLDVTNPAAPTQLAHVSDVTVTDVNLFGERAIVVGGNELAIVDVSTPATPVVEHRLTTQNSSNHVQVEGGIAWVAGGALQAARIALPVGPQNSTSLVSPGANDVVAEGDKIFVAASAFEIRDRTTLIVAASLALAKPVEGIDIAGDHVYLANGMDGLRVIDISNPVMPQLIGTYDTPQHAFDVAVAGDYAYVADGGNRARIIDVQDPTAPHEETDIVLPGDAQVEKVALQGHLAFFAIGTRGLWIVDITDPLQPTFVAHVDNITGQSVDVDGDYAYVASGFDGFRVYDLLDPANPNLVTTIDTPGNVRDVKVSGNLLAVADGAQGYRSYDVTNPASPVSVGQTSSGGLPIVALAVDGLDVLAIRETPQNLNSSQIRKVHVRQDLTDTARNEGRSLAIDDETRAIPRARLFTPSVTGLSWELSSDGGTTWEPALGDGTWAVLSQPADQLVWRSTHDQILNKPNPTASGLTIDWRTDSARMTDIRDVPKDDGGWVRIDFNNSGYDFADETSFPVTGYQLYRRVDNLLAATQSDSGTDVSGRAPFTAARASLHGHVQQIGNRFFVQGGSGGPAPESSNGFPPGTWELLSFYAATQQESYLLVAPTLADGVATEFLLTTHTTTPAVWFVSDTMTGTSKDNDDLPVQQWEQ